MKGGTGVIPRSAAPDGSQRMLLSITARTQGEFQKASITLGLTDFVSIESGVAQCIRGGMDSDKVSTLVQVILQRILAGLVKY
jgi:hypothetical protein